MRLTTKGEYALKGVFDLINNGGGNPVRLQEIAERQNIARSYLEQLFYRMRKAGLVRSVRGPGGGYVLAKNLEDITVRDVLSSVGECLQFEYTTNASKESALFNAYFSELTTRTNAFLVQTLKTLVES